MLHLVKKMEELDSAQLLDLFQGIMHGVAFSSFGTKDRTELLAAARAVSAERQRRGG